MEPQKHLAIEIVPASHLDKGQTNNQFACLHVTIVTRMGNQTDHHRNYAPATIGAAHHPTGEPTIAAALSIGLAKLENQDILDGLLKVITDYIEQIQL